MKMICTNCVQSRRPIDAILKEPQVDNTPKEKSRMETCGSSSGLESVTFTTMICGRDTLRLAMQQKKAAQVYSKLAMNNSNPKGEPTIAPSNNRAISKAGLLPAVSIPGTWESCTSFSNSITPSLRRCKSRLDNLSANPTDILSR